MEHKYTCGQCGVDEVSDRSDEEAMAEARLNESVLGPIDGAEMVTICDDCYTLMAPPGGWPASRTTSDTYLGAWSLTMDKDQQR